MAQHEIGVIGGGINGLSHKYWYSDRLAVQTDLAVGLTAAVCGIYEDGSYYGGGTNPQYDFTINPNLEYHFPLTSIFQIYTGAGLNFGLISDLGNVDPNLIWGKFGANGIVGFSLFLGNHATLALDFRPGYGLGFYDAETAHISFFDWKIGLAIRYRI